MKHIIFLALTTPLFLPPWTGFAQGAVVEVPPTSALNVESLPLSLESAIAWALRGNPESQLAQSRVDAANGRAVQARAWANPELELSVDDWPVHGSRGYSSSKRMVGITQSLPFPGKRSLDRKIGTAGVKLSEAEQAWQRGALIRDVSIAYYRVLAAEASLEEAGQLLRVAQGSAEVAKKRVSAGAAALQEQLRAELQAEQSQLQYDDIQAERAAARTAFGRILGDVRQGEAKLSGVLSDQVVEALLEGKAEGRVGAHASMVVARQEMEHAELLLRRSRLESYSDVKLGLAGGRVGASDDSIVQLSISVPLPIFDRGKGREQEARAHVSAARAQFESQRLELAQEWALAAQRYRTAAGTVGKYRTLLLPKAEEAQRLVRRGFEEGKFGLIDLLDTQRSTGELRLAYQQKLFELNKARAELEALGTQAGNS